jgi:hypothetical protein
MVKQMSKISTVYTALIGQAITLFPAKTRLHNPYNLDENPDIVKKDSWGLKVEGASQETVEYCNLSIQRTFTIVFLRQFVSLASKEDGFDAVTALLLEDQQTFAGVLYSPNEIGQQSNIDKIEVDSISGIQELVSGEKKYLFNEITFNILISETIN